MTSAHIVQVDPVLTEDGKTVLFYGHTDDDDVLFLQSVTLPIAIEEQHFDRDEWQGAVRADQWRLAA